MGRLAERLCRSKRLILVNRRSALAIERDVCRRLDIRQTSKRLAALEVGFSTIEGGRRRVDVVEIGEAGGKAPPLAYGVKASHGSEPWGAQVASDLGIGPAVLDVSGDGVIVEEFFPEALNIRNRRPLPPEHEPYAKALSRLFLAMVRTAEGTLLRHGDERPDHLFLVGGGQGIEVKLIDWGRADTRPLEGFPEWGKDQFCWLYEQLSFGRPAIWTAMAAWLAEGCPDPPGRTALADAYRGFVAYETLDVDDSARDGLAETFLEFSVACGRLQLDLGWFNAFVRASRGLSGGELVQAYRCRQARARDATQGEAP